MIHTQLLANQHAGSSRAVCGFLNRAQDLRIRSIGPVPHSLSEQLKGLFFESSSSEPTRGVAQARRGESSSFVENKAHMHMLCVYSRTCWRRSPAAFITVSQIFDCSHLQESHLTNHDKTLGTWLETKFFFDDSSKQNHMLASVTPMGNQVGARRQCRQAVFLWHTLAKALPHTHITIISVCTLLHCKGASQEAVDAVHPGAPVCMLCHGRACAWSSPHVAREPSTREQLGWRICVLLCEFRYFLHTARDATEYQLFSWKSNREIDILSKLETLMIELEGLLPHNRNWQRELPGSARVKYKPHILGMTTVNFQNSKFIIESLLWLKYLF